MCGLFGLVFPAGIASEFHPQVKALFNAMAVFSAERGQDSTGVAVVQHNGKSETTRTLVSAYSCTNGKGWRATLRQLQPGSFALLGHTRKQSVGKVSIANAHPFTFLSYRGELVGTHNGTLTKYDALGPVEPFETDSANLFYSLADTRTDEDIVATLKKAEGTYALAWADGGRFQFAKTYMADLYRAAWPDTGAVVYASTKHILLGAASFAGVRLSNIEMLLSGRLYVHTENTSYEKEYWVTSYTKGPNWCSKCFCSLYGEVKPEQDGSYLCLQCHNFQYKDSWESWLHERA